MDIMFNIIIGIVAGISSGFFGIGGAIILVPALVYAFRLPQHLAQGTALAALLLPVGIFAVMKYYNAGNVNVKAALLISLGFLLGGFIGASFAHIVPNLILKKIFGLLLLGISFFMLFGK